MIILGAGAFVVLAAAGSLLRVLLIRFDLALPVRTIGVNTAASFAAGLVAASDRPTVVLVGIGFCGSLSTFSTLVHHLHEQSARKRPAQVLATLGLSLGLGLAAALAGLEITGA